MKTRSQSRPPPPAVERLPVELWQNVLLRLVYFDLKVVQRVCKTWRKLIKTTAFDPLLFRSKAISDSKISPDTPVAVHPAFQHMPSFLSNSFLYGKTHHYKIGKVASEMATYPASNEVELSGILSETLFREQEGGVTVGRLCREVNDFCTQEAPENEVQALRASDREGYWYWIKEGSWEDHTLLAWHRWNTSDSLYLEGMGSAEVCDDGAVRMEAHIC